jgi:hypothetical protein
VTGGTLPLRCLFVLRSNFEDGLTCVRNCSSDMVTATV